MAILGNESILFGVTGKVGGFIVRKINGKSVISLAVKSQKKTSTPAQHSTRDRFSNGVKYAKQQQASPEKRAIYQNGMDRKFKSVYAAAVADFITPPVIQSITAKAGQSEIHVMAQDDFRVVSVLVVLYDEMGIELERGQAAFDTYRPFNWIYKPGEPNVMREGVRVKAVAYDLPGNMVEKEVVI